VTVRQRFSDASRYEPGQELQHYTFTAVGWPGARLVVTGNTAAVEAEGQLEADTPRAALALWKALG
jgi:hypothetical protein